MFWEGRGSFISWIVVGVLQQWRRSNSTSTALWLANQPLVDVALVCQTQSVSFVCFSFCPFRISPLYHASSMRAPLIIAQGANDPRVKRAESDQIYNALRGKGLEVQYFLYEGGRPQPQCTKLGASTRPCCCSFSLLLSHPADEGHGFALPPIRLDICPVAAADQMLAHILEEHHYASLVPHHTTAAAAACALVSNDADEGHGFALPPIRLDFRPAAAADQMLTYHTEQATCCSLSCMHRL
jgi:hypothetical protein